MTQVSDSTRAPYDAHLCAQNPTLWEAGFNFARVWVEKLAPPGKAEAIHRAVRDSTGTPFPETAARLGLRPGVFVEGFVLGVYGVVALREAAAQLAKTDDDRCQVTTDYHWGSDGPDVRCLLKPYDPETGHLGDTRGGQRFRWWPEDDEP